MIAVFASVVNYYVVWCMFSYPPLITYTPSITSAPPTAPATPSVSFSNPREEFIITWPPLSMDETVDAYFINISGPNNDLCGNDSVNTLQRVAEPNYTCSIQAMPQGDDTYTIRVQAANCDGDQRGPESSRVYLQGIHYGDLDSLSIVCLLVYAIPFIYKFHNFI